MKKLTTLFLFLALAAVTIPASAQDGRSFVTGYFQLMLDGSPQGVVAPIDSRGNATFDNVSPGNYSVAMLLPAIQKVREAAARGAHIDIESFSWGVSNSGGAKRTATGTMPSRISMTPTKARQGKLSQTVKYKGEEYYKIELENVQITSYQVSGAGTGNSSPMESLSLNFTKIKYDLKENKK